MPRQNEDKEAPPLLAYIMANKDEEQLAARRRDAEEAIGRLYREQADLIEADKAAPAEIAAANAAALEIAAEVAAIEERLAAAMEADPGQHFPELRTALADARGRLVDARSCLDRLIRAAAERTRRLSQIVQDIESWDDRRHAAGRALLASRSRRGAVSS